MFDVSIARTLLPALLQALISNDCEVRGDEAVCAIDNRVIAAGEVDWSTEYLDAVLSVKTVSNVDEAIQHINRYGSPPHRRNHCRRTSSNREVPQ